jgi:hypothetical protein
MPLAAAWFYRISSRLQGPYTSFNEVSHSDDLVGQPDVPWSTKRFDDQEALTKLRFWSFSSAATRSFQVQGDNTSRSKRSSGPLSSPAGPARTHRLRPGSSPWDGHVQQDRVDFFGVGGQSVDRGTPVGSFDHGKAGFA